MMRDFSKTIFLFVAAAKAVNYGERMTGRLKEEFLEGLKYDSEKRIWLTRIDEFKKKKGRKGTFEEASTKILDGEGLYLILTVAGRMNWRTEYTFQGVRKSFSPGQ